MKLWSGPSEPQTLPLRAPTFLVQPTTVSAFVTSPPPPPPLPLRLVVASVIISQQLQLHCNRITEHKQDGQLRHSRGICCRLPRSRLLFCFVSSIFPFLAFFLLITDFPHNFSYPILSSDLGLCFSLFLPHAHFS